MFWYLIGHNKSRMPKHWKSVEIALACKAYISATLNPVSGADQDFHAFTTDLVKKYEVISLSSCADRTYYRRGDRVYAYLRDNVFPSVQKFQKALRVVYSSNPTGVTEQESINMAVAIHCKETKSMEYIYKSFDPKAWKCYEGWVHLNKIPKFAYTSHLLAAELPSLQDGVEENANIDYTTPDEDNGTASTVETTPPPSRLSSRGVRRGKKAAVVMKAKEGKEKRKREREDERDKKFSTLVEDIGHMKTLIKQKSMSTILTRALKSTADPEIKKQLEDKIVKIALDLVV